MNVQEIKAQVKQLEADYYQKLGEFTNLSQQHVAVQKDIHQVKKDNQIYEQTRIILQKTASDARKKACERLEETVTDALRYVFGDDFQFIIELKEVRGRSEAEFYVESDYNGERVRTKPEDSRGGGVVDIISIALRVALVQIYNNPIIRGPIVLDEPGKHVSVDFTTQLANFLKQVNQTFNRQIILSTHQPDLAAIADHSLEVEIKGGRSVVTEKVGENDDPMS